MLHRGHRTGKMCVPEATWRSALTSISRLFLCSAEGHAGSRTTRCAVKSVDEIGISCFHDAALCAIYYIVEVYSGHRNKSRRERSSSSATGSDAAASNMFGGIGTV